MLLAVDIDTDSVTLFAIDLSLCLNVCMDIDSDINLVNALAGVTAVETLIVLLIIFPNPIALFFASDRDIDSLIFFTLPNTLVTSDDALPNTLVWNMSPWKAANPTDTVSDIFLTIPLDLI